jgi:hypothetical protein
MNKWWDRRSKEQIKQEWWDEVTDPASYIAAAILRLGDRNELLAQRVSRIGPAAMIAGTFGGVLVADEPRLQIGHPVAFAIALVASGTMTLLPGQVEWLRQKRQLPGAGYPRRFRKWLWAVELVVAAVIVAAGALPHDDLAHSVTVAVASVCFADLSVPVVCWLLLVGIDPHVGRTPLRSALEGDQVAPPANVQYLQKIYRAWERRKFKSARWAHPAIEFQVLDGSSVTSGTGVAGLKEAWHSWSLAWAQFQAVAYKFMALDGERVLVLVEFSEPRKRSGTATDEGGTQWINLFHVNDDKVTRLLIDHDPDRALSELTPPSGDDQPA